MQEGTVKWFGAEKGYGFISVRGDDGSYHDYFFHISEVDGPEAPKTGDTVNFQPAPGKHGKKKATKVVVTETCDKPTYRGSAQRTASIPKAVNRNFRYHDDRIECVSCGKRIVPRIRFGKDGLNDERICPFCLASQEPRSGNSILETIALLAIGLAVYWWFFN
ncbi:cold-shock protein [Roseovarius indicus]|uniref:cold-shock protein n=1 Tax=Roseovarius indicus TaxID=540747 RepID=UPI0009EF0572|nr:cold shock domain-containing protein [Roseovarius indicus]